MTGEPTVGEQALALADVLSLRARLRAQDDEIDRLRAVLVAADTYRQAWEAELKWAPQNTGGRSLREVQGVVADAEYALLRAAQGALVESPLLTLRTALAALEADR